MCCVVLCCVACCAVLRVVLCCVVLCCVVCGVVCGVVLCCVVLCFVLSYSSVVCLFAETSHFDFHRKKPEIKTCSAMSPICDKPLYAMMAGFPLLSINPMCTEPASMGVDALLSTHVTLRRSDESVPR